MKIQFLFAGAAAAALLAGCAGDGSSRQTARVEARPAPVTSPAARNVPPRATPRPDAARTETARVAPAARAPNEPVPSITGPVAGEMNIGRLIGTDVKDPAGQTIGEIENVLLDGTGRVESVIISTGGFFGFGGRDVELRWADLKAIDPGREVRVDMTAMQLRLRPEWRPNASGTTTTGGAAPK